MALLVAPPSNSRHPPSHTAVDTTGHTLASLMEVPPRYAQSSVAGVVDEVPWPELDERAVRELVHKERFHSASICLVWLQSSLTCLQCYNLHR